MNGEKFIIQKEYFETASVLADVLMNYINQQRVVIAVAGESGSGKSITALCLKEEFAKRRILASILHQDDYFFLPPKTNHNARKNDLSLVGPMEVDLDKMQSHIDDFLEGSDSIQKPTVYIQENKITEEKMFFKNSQILIVEGTY
ncbi:MAG: hypothetical protein JJU23_13475, partial [Cyclobacteriaceae bacterium]|nr:hypothetical protein [Cyclobacteriaceae bacterium]